MTVAGTSTLHDWESEVTKVDWSGQLTLDDKKMSEINGVKVVVPVTSIKSTKGKIMDNKTYEAFNYEKNPNVTYQLTAATVEGQKINATGVLSMAGASKTIKLEVTYKTLANGDIQLVGSHTMNMRDYKMEPPTAVMGTIKVGEEVTIKFDLTLSLNKTITNAKK